MDFTHLISVALVSVGAIFMGASILVSSGTYKGVPADLLRKWTVMTGMMVFFLIGYMGFIAVEVFGIAYYVEFITSVIFLGGAIFVYLVINLSRTTINEINLHAARLKEAHDNLEIQVEERTMELRETMENLRHEVEVRERAEKNIAHSHAELSQIFNTVTDGMRIIDKEFNVIRVNDTFQVLTRLATNQMIGRKCHEIFHSTTCRTPECPLRRIVAGEEHIENEVEKIRSDGTSVTCILTATPYRSPEGQLRGIIETFKDISPRKEMEEKLVESLKKSRELAGEIASKHEELEKVHEALKNTQAQMLQREMMASIGQLAAGVAHEINNPMAFVTSNLGTLQGYVSKFIEFIETQRQVLASLGAEEQVLEAKNKLKFDFLVKDVGELLHESIEGAERVVEIVRNLKDYSRIDDSDISLSDINECMETTLKVIGNELKPKTKVHRDYGELRRTFCHSRELNQVFMNILVNSAQAMEEKGEITVRTRQEGNNIKIVISDTGCGIAENKIKHIFEPFFTTSEVGKGIGLGLSICYDIIKKHEGEIAVESEVGRGTTFTVILPTRDVEV